MVKGKSCETTCVGKPVNKFEADLNLRDVVVLESFQSRFLNCGQ